MPGGATRSCGRTVLIAVAAHLAVFGLAVAPVVAQAEPALVAEGAEVTKLAGGFRFTEGPAVDREGNVYFTDVPNARVHRWSVDGKLSTVREQSGRANGLFFDRAGNLLCCEGAARRLTAVAPDGTVTVLASEYDGKPLNSPNDLWIDPAGGVYFTDPRYGRQDGLEQGGFHVYYLDADRKRLARVIDDLRKPNGVVGTADGKRLYVADTVAKKTFVYDITSPGVLEKKRVFAEQGSDGMTLDARGNVYLTRGAVTVYAPDGKRVLAIEVPEAPSNVVFGGQDRKTLFITARTSLYALRMAVSGQHD